MADYYADSSILVKRHIRETGTEWLRTLVSSGAGNTIITTQISIVEVFSAFNRRVREGMLGRDDYTALRADFTALCASEYQMLDLSAPVLEQACRLLERYPLRAYDAVQLAAALVANTTLLDAGLPALILLSADDRLLVAAQAEGLAVDNPNAHP